MNKKLKKVLAVSAGAMGMGIVLPTVAVVAAPVSKNGWVTEKGIQYYYLKGVKVLNNWAKDSNGWCFLSAIDGSWVQEGWAKDSTGWCYIRNGYWVDHATWIRDSAGWQFIGADGYWKDSVVPRITNPINVATDAVAKAEVSKLQIDVDAAKILIAELNDAIPEKAELTVRINAVDTNFKVSSVTVVDATHIKVEFSHEVDAGTSEKIDNYTFGDDLKVNTAKVQADGKTVLITFASGDALTNDDEDGYIVQISGVKNKYGNVVNDYNKVLAVYDIVCPKVISIGMKDAYTLQINFSESIRDADETSIELLDKNGGALDITDNVDIDKNNASIVTISGLIAKEDIDYTLAINSGVKDLAGNKIAPYKEEFKLKKDITSPDVESVEAISLTTLMVTFNKPINASFSVYIDGNIADADITAVSGTNKKAFYVTFDDEKGDDTFKIKISGYKDLAGNEGDNYTESLKFVDTAPKLTSTTEATGPKVKNTKVVDLKTITVTFDEAIDNLEDMDAEDFEVTVDGKTVDIDDVEHNKAGTTWTLTLEDKIDSDYDTVKAGTSSKFDGEDGYGNNGITKSMKTAED